MDLKQQLINFGCSAEFVDIALGYEDFYNPEQDIEAFIEHAEEKYAKIEATKEMPNMDREVINVSGIFELLEEEIHYESGVV